MLPNFKVERSKTIFWLINLKPFRSRFQNTKPFASALILARDRVNWNAVTSALWPNFLGQGQRHGHSFDIVVLFPSNAISKTKICFPAPWDHFVTHTHTHARTHTCAPSYYKVLARAVNAHVRCIQAHLFMSPMSILYETFHMSQIWVKIWPWGLGQRRTPVGHHYGALKL